jgi:hypothetical protein
MQNKGCAIGTLAIAAFIGFAMTPFGCHAIWNTSASIGLKQDMGAVFRNQGVDLKNAECSMIDMSRRGNCDFTATRSDIDKLTRGLQMEKVPPYANRSDGDNHMNVVAQRLAYSDRDENSKLASDYLAGKPVDVYATTRAEPRSLEAPIRPAGFAYLTVYHDPASGKASACTCYLYGDG